MHIPDSSFDKMNQNAMLAVGGAALGQMAVSALGGGLYAAIAGDKIVNAIAKASALTLFVDTVLIPPPLALLALVASSFSHISNAGVRAADPQEHAMPEGIPEDSFDRFNSQSFGRNGGRHNGPPPAARFGGSTNWGEPPPPTFHRGGTLRQRPETYVGTTPRIKTEGFV